MGLLRVSAAAAVALCLAASAASAGMHNCQKRAGLGWGFTMDMAKFQSFEIIQQVTGNWPIQSDDIKIIKQTCKADGGGYNCRTEAHVCKKG